MGRSLGVTLLFVAALVLVVSIGRDVPEAVRPFDYQPVVEQARRAAPYDILAPRNLDDGWYSNGAAYTPSADGTRWHVGFVSSDGEYIGIDQSDGDVDRFVQEMLVGFKPDGTTSVAGVGWERWRKTDGRTRDRALVRVSDDVATVIIGTGSFSQIEDFVATLQ